MEQENKNKVNALLTADRKKSEEIYALQREKDNTKHQLEKESLKKTVEQLRKQTNQGLTVHQGSAQEIILGKYLEGLYPRDKLAGARS